MYFKFIKIEQLEIVNTTAIKNFIEFVLSLTNYEKQIYWIVKVMTSTITLN